MASWRGSSAALIGALRRPLVITMALVAAMLVLMLPVAFAYRESMSELIAGDTIFQNQSYSTSLTQSLAHQYTDAELSVSTYDFGGSPLHLSETSINAGVAAQSGNFSSSATSDLILPYRMSYGYMGTFMGDPLSSTGLVGSGILYPQLSKIDFSSANFDMFNTSALDNASSGNTSSNVSDKTSVFKTINQSDPLGHQLNKPFAADLSVPLGPHKINRSTVQNMSSWDRFLTNTIGRSTTDRAFNGTTSAPTDITPANALAPYVPVKFMSDALNMTAQGTQLSNRFWPI
jgi:hypothetical protein